MGLSDKSFDLVASGNQLSLKLIDVLISLAPSNVGGGYAEYGHELAISQSMFAL